MWGSNSRPSDTCYGLWDWRAAYCANEALTEFAIEPSSLKGTTTTCKKVCLLVEHILKYFTGNRDQNSVVQHGLYPRIKAYIIRVHPWGWYRHISMRVEFYGCREGEMNDSSYKVITKQIFISQETLHRVLILSFADPKTNAAKKACKRYEGTTGVWTAEQISKWGADWWLEVGEALPSPPQLRRPCEAPPNLPEIRLVMFRSREGVFQPISRNWEVMYCQNEDGLLQLRHRTEKQTELKVVVDVKWNTLWNCGVFAIPSQMISDLWKKGTTTTNLAKLRVSNYHHISKNFFFKVVVFIIFTLKIVNTCIKNSFQFSDRCVMPLGLEDKRVPNGHLTASSYYNYHLSPWYGRLNSIYSWSVRRNRVGQWFQVNFMELMRIKGVATQGRQNANQWVRSYTVRYSVDGMSFRLYGENRRVKVMYYRGYICLKSQVY